MAKKQLTIEEKLEAALVPVEEQPYKVPENWCWSYLENVCQIIMGQSPKGADTTMDDSYTPLIGGAADLGDNAPSINKYTKSVTKLSQCGDLIICIRATLGRPVIADGEYCLGRGVAGCRSSRIDISFLRFFFINFERYLYDNATGSTFAQVTSKVLGKMPIPLPPFLEQSRIVARIESLFAKLDEAKEKIQEVLDGADLRRATILHQAFTGKLTTIENADDEYSIFPSIRQWGKDLPNRDRKILIEEQDKSEKIYFQDGREWIKCTIGAIGKVSNGSTPSRKCSNYWDGNIPWVSSGEVNNNVIANTKERITQEGYENSSVKLLPVGTVLIAMIGEGKTRGQSAILDIEATTNQNIAAVIINHGKVLPKFLWFWFQFNYTKNREKGAGSGPQALNCQRVRELDFVCPSVCEQQEIVRLLDNLLSREQSTVTACEEALTTIDTLKKSILARALRGELGTNDPAEPNAKELLKDILSA